MRKSQRVRQMLARLTTALVLGLFVGLLGMSSAHASSTLTIKTNISNLTLVNVTTSAGPLPIQIMSGYDYAGSITPASLNGTTLPFLYCVDMEHYIYVPGTYTANVTLDGKVHGTPVAHADQVAWLLDHHASDASGDSLKTAALQTAIWEVIYGEQFTLNGSQAIVEQQKSYLTGVGTASIANYTWLSPVDDGSGEPRQGLVTRVPEPSSTLLLGIALVGLACALWRHSKRARGRLNAA